MLNQQAIQKLCDKYNKDRVYPVSAENFIENAERYIKAIKQGRMICSIGSVSSSGASRTMKFLELARGTPCYSLLNFFQFFCMLEYRAIKDNDYFRINGGGMDMVFNTNYCIIHKLYKLGFLSAKARDKLAQSTPRVI